MVYAIFQVAACTLVTLHVMHKLFAHITRSITIKHFMSSLLFKKTTYNNI